jgi:hypothetical protein
VGLIRADALPNYEPSAIDSREAIWGYVPFANPKVLWPASLVGLVLVTYGWAALEHRAFQTGTRTFALGLTIAAIAVVVRTIDAARRQDRAFVDFEGRPTPATQRLGLFDHVGGQS